MSAKPVAHRLGPALKIGAKESASPCSHFHCVQLPAVLTLTGEDFPSPAGESWWLSTIGAALLTPHPGIRQQHISFMTGQIRTDVEGEQDLRLGAKASFAPSTKWLCFVWTSCCCCCYIWVIKPSYNQLAFLHGSLQLTDEENSPQTQNLQHINTVSEQ